MPSTEEGSGAGPATTKWRRERLFRIGSHTGVPTSELVQQHTQPPVTEATTLRPADRAQSYGSLPSPGSVFRKGASAFQRRARPPNLPNLNLPTLRRAVSNPTSPALSPSIFRGTSRLTGQRPISAYDRPAEAKDNLGDDELDAKINGVRVWYSSFTSIDWLHDAIKDSVRFARLRRRKSIRARLRLAFDKSLGWIVVTIVGFLTAIIAFLVVRAEQWLFDFKEGICRDGWWKAQRFCCPLAGEIVEPEEVCAAWAPWSELLHWEGNEAGETAIEYISFGVIALLLAWTSCMLTIYLTNSSTFATRKESSVLGPSFDDGSDTMKDLPPQQAPKRKIMYYASGSGIPEIKTILSGFVIHGYLGGRTLFTKSVGLALSVASGLSLGKEGPFVHIASCIGNIVSRFTTKYENNEAKRREILSAACAAGVAVAFGAPIGGTLFSLEEVSYFFPPKVMWRSFFCAMIAAITLRALDPFGTGKLVLFQVTYDTDWHAYELFPFILLGIFGGVYGAYFSKLNYRWSRDIRNKTWMKSHPVSEVLLITLVTTILCFVNQFTRMGGTELVYNLFAECRKGSQNDHSGLCDIEPASMDSIRPRIGALALTIIIKGFLTVVTFGIKVPAGIFIPTLGVGACAGRIVGLLTQYAKLHHPDAAILKPCGDNVDCIIPGLYAMVGAAAALSGVTRTTVSLAVIMFELTDTLTYAVPVMLAVLVAKTVADALEPKGIYDLVIELSQLPFLDLKEEYIWGSLQIGDVSNQDVQVIRLDHDNTVKDLWNQLHLMFTSGNDDGGFPILRRSDEDEDSYRMVGYIGANELEHALSIVADEADQEINFHVNYGGHHLASSSMSLASEAARESMHDPFDFTMYMDQAPLTVTSNCPLEMVHQLFTKLGARYVVVTDADGLYEGVIDKKTWLAFLSGVEEK